MDFTQLPVQPGDFVSIRAEAEDVGGNSAFSKPAEILIAGDGQGTHRRLVHLLEENRKQLSTLAEKLQACGHPSGNTA